VIRPIVRFLKVPVVIRPPDLPARDERTARDLVRHLDFVGRYLNALTRNPAWSGDRDALDAALGLARELRTDAANGTRSLAELSDRLAHLEKDRVEALLDPLDRQATDLIRQEALRVGLATAVSPYGRIDAFLVLWRNCNLVARMATIYYGRPGVRGTLSILRDVSVATMVGAYLEDLTDVAGDMVASLAGKTAGVLAGPLLDGSLNAIGTLRIGYLAKARCRAFSKWTDRTRADAVRGALVEAGRISRGVVADVVRTVGGGLLKLPARAISGVLDRLGSLFRPPAPDQA
jgi:uncharacterized membrane protein YcjF (UPF0283 family)